MEKLRLNLDELQVESFEASAEAASRGTVAGHEYTECSCQDTCGIASAGAEGFAKAPPTYYGCCI